MLNSKSLVLPQPLNSTNNLVFKPIHKLLKSMFFSFLPILICLTWLSPSRSVNDCDEFIPCEYFGFYAIVN